MSSSFFQEPLRSSSPRSFMPKDLRGGEEKRGGAWGCQGHCAPSLESWRDQTRSIPGAEEPNSVNAREV